ncbi:hypothetical protein [Actinomyces sp. MRS3W]|uniref:hypothetical protein n=1 Tax=Actinomyces sp. MRS3W TaxID=2800796 RepID=UPI0028FD4139|nr:hypothetical protein [Actinomyces sp. MRS3W]MDU0347563.1 hypothetical protein [Actinomyces sp. MRS3W]
MSNQPAPNYQSVPYGQPVYVQPTNPADSVGSWMLAMLITAIPIVGFIYLLVVAFGGSASVSRRNWARAAFAWQIIAIVLGVLLYFVVIAGTVSSGNY